MVSNTYITLDLQAPNIAVVAAGKQNDLMSRQIVCQLQDGSVPFTPPVDAAAMIRYAKPDNTAGFYDVLEDGTTPAWSVRGSTITITLCEQMLTVPGRVWVEINFYTQTEKLTTFYFLLEVQRSVLKDATIISSDYYNVLSAQVAAAIQAAEDAAAIAANLPVPSDALPQDLGTATPGTSASYSRGDHVHKAPALSELNNDVPFMSMGRGETVPVNSDLNNYTAPGVYYVPTGSEASQILNSPITTSGYRLEVKRTTGDLGRIQIAYANVGNTAIYARTLSIPAASWGAWTKIGQKAIALTVGDADAGITSFRRAVYDPNSNTVRVYVSARNMSDNILTTSVLGVIPDGYRPSSEALLMGFFVASDGSVHSYIGRVKTDGSICQNLGNTVRQTTLVGEYTL